MLIYFTFTFGYVFLQIYKGRLMLLCSYLVLLENDVILTIWLHRSMFWMMKRKRRNVPNTRNVLAQRLECLECPLNPPNSEKKEILERSECSECRKETALIHDNNKVTFWVALHHFSTQWCQCNIINFSKTALQNCIIDWK